MGEVKYNFLVNKKIAPCVNNCIKYIEPSFSVSEKVLIKLNSII